MNKLCDYCTSPYPQLETEEGLVFCDETCHHYFEVTIEYLDLRAYRRLTRG